MEFLWWIFVFVLIFALLGAGAWFLRGYLTGEGGSTGMFGAPRERRIGVSATASIDGRRRLLLIYRDGVEHLVMTGGPIDVVIEQGIQPPRRQAYEPRQATPHPADPAEAGQSSSAFGRVRQRVSQPSLDQ
jgi:hypothetical protein